MTQLQLKQIHQREVRWERAMLAFFLLFQLTATLFIYLHDSQSGFIAFAIVTTFVKSVVMGAIMIELLRFADRIFKKHWLYTSSQEPTVKNLELLHH